MQKILGSALKREREMRGIALPEIAREMNISLRYLTALEDEAFDLISGDFYVRHYIRSYLRAIGADETDFFNRYRDYLNGLLKERNGSQTHLYFDKIRFTKFRKRRIVAGFILLALGLAAVVLFAGRLNWTAWFAGLRKPARPLVLPVSAQPVRAAGVLAQPDFPALQLDIVSSGRSWIRVSRGAETLVEKTMESGDTLRLSGYELTLSMGNPAVLALRLNGRSYALPNPGAGPMRVILTPADVPPSPDRHE